MASALRALGEFAGVADDKSVKIVLRRVDVQVYKVLKLMKLAHRFSLLAERFTTIPGWRTV
jgi:hypothetical protein